MITDVHTSYLAIMLRTSEQDTKGWAELLDLSISRCSEVIVNELRAKLATSQADTDGWRTMHDYASANRALPAELAHAEADRMLADVAQFSTGARLDAPPKPCSCGDRGALGVVHRSGGHPCYTIDQPVAVSLLGDDPTPTSMLPEVPESAREPYASPYPKAAPEPQQGPPFKPFGEPLPPRQEQAVNAMVSEHLVQDHDEALKDDAKWEKKHR